MAAIVLSRILNPNIQVKTDIKDLSVTPVVHGIFRSHIHSSLETTDCILSITMR